MSEYIYVEGGERREEGGGRKCGRWEVGGGWG